MKHYTASSEKRSEKVEMWRHDVPGLENTLSASGSSAGQPPAYTAVLPSNQTDGSEHLCCALRLQFLYWVAIHRSRQQKIPTLERLHCPLLWCRMSFNEHEKLVDHVSTCPHLDQGQYWCPYHQQAERFAQPISDRVPGGASPSSRRPSWKAAVKAIRRLGSKGFQIAIHPSRSRKSESHKWQVRSFETNKGYQGNIPELMSEAQPLELEGRESVQSAHNGTEIHEAASAYLPSEMEGTCNHAAELESETLSCPSMDWESTGNITPESSLSPISPVSPGNPWHRHVDEHLHTPISPADLSYTVPWAADEPRLCKVTTTTPVKQSPSVPYWLSTLGTKEHITDPGSIHMENAFADTKVFMWSNEVIRDDQSHSTIQKLTPARAPSHEDESEFGVDANANDRRMSLSWGDNAAVPSPVRHVEDLRDIFHILFEDSMYKLNQPPVSQQAMTLIKLRPSATFLLENGFAALRKIINEENKLSFWEVFGLSHLAYASAILSDPVDLKQEFRQIFIEITRLSSHINCDEDKVAFMQLVRELWLPELYSAGSITSSNEDLLHMNTKVIQPSSETVSSATMEPLASATLGIHTSTYMNRGSVHSFENNLRERSDPVGSMINSRAVQHCLQTLESFEHADNETRNPLSTLAEANEGPYLLASKNNRQNRTMRQYITEPLIQEIGFEGFMPIVINADKLLEGANKVGLRELELKLLNESKHHAKSQVLYDEFTKLVMYLCDRASMIIGGEYRTRKQHYLQDIDHILCIYSSLQQHESKQPEQAEDQNQSLPARVRRSSRAVTGGPKQGDHMSSEETDFFHPQVSTPFDESPASDSSGFYDPGMIDHYGRIPDLPELDSDSPSEHVDDVVTQEAEPSASPRDPSVQAGELGEGSLTCLQCGKVFRGKLAWLQSNLQRHMREKHSAAKKIVCEFPGCGKSFIRKHNLKVHVETVHGRTRGL
ncbi:hypothetical protein MMC11_007823 [Xylographa trunciseda]|nr:hypothetical protein [Xylographa trunciseda]